MCALASTQLYAQALPQERKSITDLAEVPDAYIEEAFAFYDQCEGSIEYNRHYDCECLSVKYLDVRIEYGGGIGKGGILQEIEGECPDTTRAAGVQYNDCMSKASLLSVDMPIDKYCECVANEYGKIYERLKPEPNSRNFVAIKSEALKRCRDPRLEATLYKDK
jgi:hypothetical protein